MTHWRSTTIRNSSLLLGVPFLCRLLPFQVLAVQLLEPPPLKGVTREAGDQAGEVEAEVGVVSGAGGEVRVRLAAMCVQVNRAKATW